MTALATPLLTPDAAKYVLAAGVAQLVPGDTRAMSIFIPTGTTVTVSATGMTNAEITAQTAEFIAWAAGAKAGPYQGPLPTPCTCLKLVSAAGGTVYIQRT